MGNRAFKPTISLLNFTSYSHITLNPFIKTLLHIQMSPYFLLKYFNASKHRQQPKRVANEGLWAAIEEEEKKEGKKKEREKERFSFLKHDNI